eukprot:2735190-Alexandrium_andersonii.AAC.1
MSTGSRGRDWAAQGGASPLAAGLGVDPVNDEDVADGVVRFAPALHLAMPQRIVTAQRVTE